MTRIPPGPQAVFSTLATSLLALTVSEDATPTRRATEVWGRAQTEAAGIVWRGNYTVSPLPHETLSSTELPDAFSWCDKGLCTMSRNQHIPQ